VKDALKELLHRYKVEAFKISHANDRVQETTEQILKSTEDALNNEYHYHFRRKPNPERIETYKLIKNYTLEALLPPIVEKLVRRITVLEKQHDELVCLIDGLVDVLSHETSVRDSNAG
jgi:hypothetical protein